MVVQQASVPPWRGRHPWVVALIAVQAVVLTVLGSLSDASPIVVLLAALALAGPAVASALPNPSRTTVASLSAAALLIQAVCTVVVAGDIVPAGLLLVAILSVVALYEVGKVLSSTCVAAVGAILVIAATHPDLLDLPGDDPLHAWGSVLAGGVVLAIGCAALATLWRAYQRVGHIADQQRRATEAYLEVAGTLMLILDRNGIVTAANRHTCLTLDREEDEVVGREWFGLALPEEYRDEARRLLPLSFEAYRETGEMSYGTIDYENEIQCRDGSRRQVEWWATMVCNRAGAPVGMVCSGTDVTDQRAATAALDRNRVELEALRRLAQKIASLDDSRQAVVNATLELTGASAVVILEPNRQRTHLEVTTTTREEFRGGALELGREPTFAASAFLSGQPHFIADCATSPAVHHQLVEALGLRSGLHQPIIGGHGPIGVLTVVWEEPIESLHDRRAELVGLIAHEAAISLRRRESLLQLERAALVDPLTGVANRRAFDAELPLALRRAGSGNYPLGLVVLDVNEFKAVNDRYGHEVGDELLIRAASAWAGVLRAGDLLARLGGDEFAVLLPSCDELEMAHIISRLKRATPHEPGTSMGGAMWDGTEGASSLIRRADRAQYADKAAMKAAESDHREVSPGTDASTARMIARPRAEDPRAQGSVSGDAPDDDPEHDEPRT